jgi:release factor glutamine methyltransferase
MSESAETADVWTVQRILNWTTDYLAERGVESARLEAELLCAHARQCQRIRLYTDFDVPMTDVERARMREYVQRRASREPLAYITGRREFYGRNFEVGTGILIPRPETETLIDLALEQIPDDRPSTFVEVGFGSGCIALTLAIQKPKCRIIASDISEVCLEYAQRNAEVHQVADRVNFVHGDGLHAVKPHLGDSLCDGFVSNPPYVCDHEFEQLQPEVGLHEPRKALLSGPDGLELIRQLVSQAGPILRPDGWVGMECDPAQCASVSQLMSEAGLTSTQIHRDYRNVDRIVTARNGE